MGVAAHSVRTLVAVFAAAGLICAASTANAQCADPFEVAARPGTSAFVQTRYLSGVRAPLVARGEATVAPGRIEWRVTDPVDIRTVITPAGVTQSVEGGTPQAIGPQSGDPFTTGAGLFDLLVGDLTSVRSHYTIAQLAPAESGAWRLRLTPRSTSLSRFVTQIDVRGCSAVDGLEVRQANGDWMEIALSRPDGG